MSNFHYLARALIMTDGKVLVAQANGADHVFLPGGHIEWGEKAENALVREIQEEFGQRAVITGFYGAVEHGWTAKEENFEINLVFGVEVPGISSDEPPESKEDYLRFSWCEPEELEALNLKPSPLIQLIEARDSFGSAFWSSTM